MAVSPDGTRVAVSRMRPGGSEIEIWSTDETPRITHRIPLECRTIHLAFLDSSRVVAWGFNNNGEDLTFVTNVESSKQLWQLPTDHMFGLESAKGLFLLVEGETARVYDAGTYQEVLATPCDYGAHLSPDGKLLAIRTLGGWRITSIDSSTEVLKIPESSNDACFSADGRAFVCSAGPGLVAFDLAARSQTGVAKSKELVGSFSAEELTPTDDGIVFRDGQQLRLWNDDKHSARSLFRSTFYYLEVTSVGDSKIWIGECSGYLRSLDLVTGELSSPLQRPMRVYAGGLWLLWCMAWFITRVRHASGGRNIEGSPQAAVMFGGPVLDVSLTLVVLIAYFAIATHVDIVLTQWDETVLLGMIGGVASAIVLWLGLGQGSLTRRLLWSVGGLGLFGAAQVELMRDEAYLGLGGGLIAAVLTWFGYRRLVRWRLARSGDDIESASERPDWPRWSIHGLIVTTAACAVIVQAVINVKDYDFFSPSIYISDVSENAVVIYLHAVVPYVALCAPWSRIKRFSLLGGLLLADFWVVWNEYNWWEWVVPNLAWSTLAICGILWLHGYRIYRDGSTPNAS